jgi:hypothetical protein
MTSIEAGRICARQVGVTWRGVIPVIAWSGDRNEEVFVAYLKHSSRCSRKLLLKTKSSLVGKINLITVCLWVS